MVVGVEEDEEEELSLFVLVVSLFTGAAVSLPDDVERESLR